MAQTHLRVLHALGSLDPGGVEMWLLNVARHIDRDRFQFDFCTFGSQPGLQAVEAEKLGSKVLRCPKGSNPWKFRNRFRRILREGGYDVVHSHVHLFSGAILRWANAEGVPVRIAHSHTSQDDKPNTLARQCYRSVMKSWIYRYATHGLAASRLAAAALFGENWQTDCRFRVLYYGVDLDAFRQPFVRDEVRSELGIPLDALVVGHVGRFVPAKNHRFLLEIASEIVRSRPEIHFLSIGDGPLRPEIEARAKAMGLEGKILFAGTRSDVPRLMRGSIDLFIFPSLYEGFGLSVLEAQAAGLRCLVSDAVPDEVGLSPESVEFLPASGGAALWARRVIALLGARKNSTSAMDSMSRDKFSIQQSRLELARVYLSMQPSHAPRAAEYVES
jgi:glycosyltransferase involved in cell wall biosynthesis